MAAPFEYTGRGDVCTGCAEVILAGDLAGTLSEDRPERLLCVTCWWLRSCQLPLPAWAGRGAPAPHHQARASRTRRGACGRPFSSH